MTAAIIAGALNVGLTPNRFGLYVNGLDVIRDPSSGGNQFGTAVESIETTEVHPGRVGAMRFVIDDPQLTCPMPEAGDTVRLQRLTDPASTAAPAPYFLGFVDTVTVEPEPAPGRTITVGCVDASVALDWARHPGAAFPASASSGSVRAAVQMLAATCVDGLALPLRALGGGALNGGQSTPTGFGPTGGMGACVVPAGTTLREAIQIVLDAGHESFPLQQAYSGVWATVDRWGGLRVWARDLLGAVQPNDWLTLVIDNTSTTDIHAASLKHTTEARPRSAYVRGPTAAASGLVTLGTGVPGETVGLFDSDATGPDDRADPELARLQLPGRGTFDIESWDPRGATYAGVNDFSTSRRVGEPGGFVQITDPIVGLAAALFVIGQVIKRYTGTTETWSVTYGNTPPSIVAALNSGG